MKTSAQTFNGFCLYCLDLTVLRPWFDTHLNAVKLQPCARIAVCSFDGQPAVIGLTERFRLFVNNIQVVPAAGSKPLLCVAVQSCEVLLYFQLATNCTSFAVHDEFFLLTTHSHTIRCISRRTKLAGASLFMFIIISVADVSLLRQT